MKKTFFGFIRRGMIACGIGPVVLAILYLILRLRGDIEILTVDQVITGTLSISALAFVAGALNELYHIERLPLMVAILIHGGVLYLCYLATYLLNGWLEQGMIPMIVFTGIFVVGYLVIWGIVYLIIRRSTQRINEKLIKKRKGA